MQNGHFIEVGILKISAFLKNVIHGRGFSSVFRHQDSKTNRFRLVFCRLSASYDEGLQIHVVLAEIMLKNLFADLPTDTRSESFDNLLEVPGLRIERIVSFGQASPPDFWYEQEHDEWVLVLQGAASLQVDGQDALVCLQPGDHYWLPAGLKHRVASTDPSGPTIWLAVHR
ncbi:MAG TPA: cupin domain-containing protein [Burkholderiaceae bacterium]|nr:cupin domain-containing protein [Burkholderiaceae bacterium]